MKIATKLLFIGLYCGFVFGQDIRPVEKQVGPDSYPPAARAVRAKGTVGVSVNVDAEGKVISAQAFSGHPLLKASAVEAAKHWLFEKVPDPTTERSFVLSFEYKDEMEQKIVDEGDKEWVSVLRLSSISPFDVVLSGETLIPRFLRLSRKEGKLPKEFCPLHKSELSVETQSVDCSGSNELYTADSKYSDSEEYDEAIENEFPKANIFVGCRDSGVERVETRFCEKCRDARKDWIVRHGV